MMIGLIGTGLMGVPMAQRLINAQQSVVAYNRTVSKLAPIEAAGGAIALSVSALLDQCDVAILMLSDATAIREVLLADEVKPHLVGKTIIQMGTIGSSQSMELGHAIAQAGAEYLEAPVLGSIPEAQAGTLQIMVGSTPDQFQVWQPLLQHLGTPLWIGAVGTAAALKLALNQLIGSLTTAFGLSLELVRQQGVPVETFMQIVRQSALYAPTFDKKLQRMLDGNFANPNFPTKHLLKDTRLFLTEAEHHGLNADSVGGVCQILERACESGLADADYSALVAALRSPTVS